MRATVLAVSLLGVSAASATPVHVDFSVVQANVYEGHAAGLYQGTFSFDDSLIAPGVVFDDVQVGRALDHFDFFWLGVHWNTSNARLARLEFDDAGLLRSWGIGGTAVSGGCANVGVLDCVGVPSAFADFALTGLRLEPGIPPPALIAVGVLSGSEQFADAGGAFTVRSNAVPEPGTLALSSIALLLLGAYARQRRLHMNAS